MPIAGLYVLGFFILSIARHVCSSSSGSNVRNFCKFIPSFLLFVVTSMAIFPVLKFSLSFSTAISPLVVLRLKNFLSSSVICIGPSLTLSQSSANYLSIYLSTFQHFATNCNTGVSTKLSTCNTSMRWLPSPVSRLPSPEVSSSDPILQDSCSAGTAPQGVDGDETTSSLHRCGCPRSRCRPRRCTAAAPRPGGREPQGEVTLLVPGQQ